jgi:WD40 repeat protein
MATRAYIAVLVSVACGGPREPTPARQREPDPRAQIATATRAWLAGDLERAATELAHAGDDPSALALLARADALLGRDDHARAAAARMLGLSRSRALEPHLPSDATRLEDVAISTDGEYVALVAHESIRVWRLPGGREVSAGAGHHVAFGRVGDATLLAVLDGDHELRAVDAATGAVRWTTQLDARTLYLKVVGPTSNAAEGQRAGTIVTMQADGTLVRWSLATGRRLRAFPTDAHPALATSGALDVSADGRTVVFDRVVYDVADAATKVGVLPVPSTAVALAPDGRTIARAYADARVELFERDGTLRARLDGAGRQVRFLDDGSLLSIHDKRVTRWDVARAARLAEVELAAGDTQTHAIEFGLGAGGHVVVRRGLALAMLNALTGSARSLAQFGSATLVKGLAWSDDGSRLAIVPWTEGLVVWSVAGDVRVVKDRYYSNFPLAFDASGDVVEVKHDEPQARFLISAARVYLLDGDGHALRFVEAPEPIAYAARAGGRLVGAGNSGAIYVWDADTAEGLGGLDRGARVDALALRPDGRTLAVARETGGVELWDLPSRMRVLGLATSSTGWVAFAPSGRVYGDARLLTWNVDDVSLPAALVPSTSERDLVADTLAHPPPAVAVQRTRAPTLSAHDCVPTGVDVAPISATLSNNALDYCLATDARTDEAYCFRVDLASAAVRGISAPLDVLVSKQADASPRATIRSDSAGAVTACAPPDVCHQLPAKAAGDQDGRVFAPVISDDGAIAAVVAGKHVIETWDVATAKRIARFTVTRPAWPQRSPWLIGLEMWGHDVLPIWQIDCAAPRCTAATVYSPRGKPLGRYPFESNAALRKRVHGDVWVITADEFDDVAKGSVLLVDASTNTRVARLPVDRVDLVAASDERIAVVVAAAPAGAVKIFDRAAKLVAQMPPPPRCR